MSAMVLWLGQIKIPVFRVTRPYLNLLMKPRISFRLSGQKYNFMHFERPFKMHQNHIFPEKIIKKNVCAYPTYLLLSLGNLSATFL